MIARSRRSDASSIKALVVAAALERGAGAVAVTSAIADESARARMRESFERGDLATWGYGEARARIGSDPSAVLDGARSVVCIAMPYATLGPTRAPLRGRVSNYAWSRDYHQRMRALLDAVARILDDAVGESVTAVACDTKPLAERAFAARGGLGWIGKHTNLIAPSLGSYVFLGEIISTFELPADTALRTSCGSCARCVDACPTGALRGDYTIDATRCISDLTQRTDAIPREMRTSIGDWVWGCDRCQEVCPPTQNAALQGATEMEALDAQAAAPALTALVRLRSGEFKRRFSRTAMGWRGAAVLRRNAAVALGNALDRAGVPSLIAALCEDPHPLVRGHSAWALGRIASPPALAALAQQAAVEGDPGAREEIERALADGTHSIGSPLK